MGGCKCLSITMEPIIIECPHSPYYLAHQFIHNSFAAVSPRCHHSFSHIVGSYCWFHFQIVHSCLVPACSSPLLLTIHNEGSRTSHIFTLYMHFHRITINHSLVQLFILLLHRTRTAHRTMLCGF
jgi:hypothetical protein